MLSGMKTQMEQKARLTFQVKRHLQIFDFQVDSECIVLWDMSLISVPCCVTSGFYFVHVE